MKFGLRTIKTAIAAPIAMFLAECMTLQYPPSAAIITILSLTNTKKSTAKTALDRLLSLSLATFISASLFLTLGFNTFVFGLYLLLFIPLSVRFKLADGIAVSSVLVTHYLTEGQITLPLLLNEYLLMTLGVGCALVANVYMPDKEKEIREDQLVIEVVMKNILNEMAFYLNESAKELMVLEECRSLSSFAKEAQKKAREFDENKLLKDHHYYFEYFVMRRWQIKVLGEMLEILHLLKATEEEAQELQALLLFTADTLAEDNDGHVIKEKIYETNAKYQQKNLPESRQEFENRAMLFQLFQLFQEFIEIKASFSQEQEAAASVDKP